VAEVELPQLGESVTEGIITAWLVEVGDEVEVDQPIVEISTDKVDTEIPSPVAGTVQELKAEVDDTIEVGQVIAVIGEGATPPSRTEDDTDDDAEPDDDAADTATADDADDADRRRHRRRRRGTGDGGDARAGRRTADTLRRRPTARRGGRVESAARATTPT
jgi:pyruvate/2-oxoglutarate dehydrogenase complex dihydrolipoamide acyltransferase (E2) component